TLRAVSNPGGALIRQLKRTGWKPVASFHSMDSENFSLHAARVAKPLRSVPSPPDTPDWWADHEFLGGLQ
ncbi:hypothetical protein, partial [Marinovum algicola]|uniref:hypothetical protein n=1 Tax=Marinovum algicola TaxID=42444 RepID=UPI0032EB19A0